jgi:hypothetical protein
MSKLLIIKISEKGLVKLFLNNKDLMKNKDRLYFKEKKNGRK